jgi:hypothetical protein
VYNESSGFNAKKGDAMEDTRPTTPNQFQDLEGIGALIEVYPAKASSVVRIGLVTVFSLLGAGALINGGLIHLSRWGEHIPSVLEESLPWLFSGLLALILALLFLRKLRGRKSRAAAVFEHGFAYADRKGIQTWRWEDVEEVSATIIRHYFRKRHTRTTHIYTLINKGGDRLQVDDALINIEAFYKHLQNNTLQLRYQRLADLYNLGEKVRFGPARIGKKLGIEIGRKTYPWDKIEEVGIHEGVLTVKKKGSNTFGKSTIKAGEIPNLHVLLSIINQVVGLKTSD